MSDSYDPFAAEKFVNPLVKQKVEALATLPKRAIESSRQSLQSGQYDPAVPLEAAALVAGAGSPFAETGALGVSGGRLTGAAAKPLRLSEAVETAPPAAGMVRLYRGGGNNPGGPKWVTTDRRYAERYTTPGLAHTTGPGSFLQYVDVPANHPLVQMPPGQSVHSFEAPPEIADRLQPFYLPRTVEQKT